MSSPLTDEQVTEALRIAGPLHDLNVKLFDSLSDQGKVRVAFLALHERLKAAEAERDEARKALPTDQQRKTLAYWIWPDAPGGWDELAAAAKKLREGHDEWARCARGDVSTARQQARREAFEEAAKWHEAQAEVPTIGGSGPHQHRLWAAALRAEASKLDGELPPGAAPNLVEHCCGIVGPHEPDIWCVQVPAEKRRTVVVPLGGTPIPTQAPEPPAEERKPPLGQAFEAEKS